MIDIKQAVENLKRLISHLKWLRFVAIQQNKTIVVYVKENQVPLAENYIGAVWQGFPVIVKEVGEIRAGM